MFPRPIEGIDQLGGAPRVEDGVDEVYPGVDVNGDETPVPVYLLSADYAGVLANPLQCLAVDGVDALSQFNATRSVKRQAFEAVGQCVYRADGDVVSRLAGSGVVWRAELHGRRGYRDGFAGDDAPSVELE